MKTTTAPADRPVNDGIPRDIYQLTAALSTLYCFAAELDRLAMAMMSLQHASPQTANRK